jgi:hypothetical protein
MADPAHRAPYCTSYDAGALTYYPGALFLFVRFRRDEAGLVTVIANIAVKDELKSCVCTLVAIVSCECVKHVYLLSLIVFLLFDFFAADRAFGVLKELRLAASLVHAAFHERSAARVAFLAADEGHRFARRTGHRK